MRRIILLVGIVFLLSSMLGTVGAQQWKLVGIITSDVARGESCILIDSLETIQEGRLILIESRSGSVRETYEVRHVYDYNVILEKTLNHEFIAGSRVFQ